MFKSHSVVFEKHQFESTGELAEKVIQKCAANLQTQINNVNDGEKCIFLF